MTGIPINYQEFTVYPEYCNLSLDHLMDQSIKTGKYQVATSEVGNQNQVVVVYRGKTIHTRGKYRLHHTEVDRGIKPGRLKPRVFNFGGRNTLILICYEIVFPEDYLDIRRKVDLIIHIVGQPMFSEEQREGWVALQKALSLVYNCPVVCCCGGYKDRMNITGVTTPGVRDRGEE